MIQKNRRLLHVTNAAIDFIIALVTYIFSERVFPLVYMRIQGSQRVLYLGTQGPLFWPILTSLLMVLLMAMFGMYNSLRTRRIRKEFWIILQTNVIVVLVISALFLLVTEQGLSRGMLLFFFGIVSVCWASSVGLCTRCLATSAEPATTSSMCWCWAPAFGQAVCGGAG